MAKGHSHLSLCFGLIRLSSSKIHKAEVRVKKQELTELNTIIGWNQDVGLLAHMDWPTIVSRVAFGEKLVIIEGVIYNIDGFVNIHPRGLQMLQFRNGHNPTKAIHVKVYKRLSFNLSPNSHDLPNIARATCLLLYLLPVLTGHFLHTNSVDYPLSNQTVLPNLFLFIESRLALTILLTITGMIRYLTFAALFFDRASFAYVFNPVCHTLL